MGFLTLKTLSWMSLPRHATEKKSPLSLFLQFRVTSLDYLLKTTPSLALIAKANRFGSGHRLQAGLCDVFPLSRLPLLRRSGSTADNRHDNSDVVESTSRDPDSVNPMEIILLSTSESASPPSDPTFVRIH